MKQESKEKLRYDAKIKSTQFLGWIRKKTQMMKKIIFYLNEDFSQLFS